MSDDNLRNDSSRNLDIEDKETKSMRRSYQVKGAHEKSYLDLSQLRFSLKDRGNSESSESESNGDSNHFHRSVSQMVTNHPSLNGSEIATSHSNGNITSRMELIPRQDVKFMRKFAKSLKTPKIFQGRYNLQSISNIDVCERRNYDQSNLTCLPPRGSKEINMPKGIVGTGKPEKKYKYVMKTLNPKRRGYYSETISPLLRPERILAARHKEMERFRQFAIETEGEHFEGDEEDLYHDKKKSSDDGDEIEEEEHPKIRKGLLIIFIFINFYTMSICKLTFNIKKYENNIPDVECSRNSFVCVCVCKSVTLPNE